jgi:uncharacterized protein (UPF0332 family)
VSARPEVREYQAKAQRALRVARSLLQEVYAPESASRAYYAMFYATQALLKSEGIEVTKHSGVEAALGQHFAKTGRLAPEFHRMLITARKCREMADYALKAELTTETAAARIEDAVAFLGALDTVLSPE